MTKNTLLEPENGRLDDEEFTDASKNKTNEEKVNEINGERVYTVTEIADIVGKSPATIRHWEKEMKGLISVSRSPQGARYYTKQDKDIFVGINKYREEKVSLQTIHDLLEYSRQTYGNVEKKEDPFATTDQTVISEIERIIKEQLQSQVLLLGDGLTEEARKIKEKTEHISRESAKRRVEAKLKSRALKEWMKEPESRRYIKTGLFRKEENNNERDSFVEEYIAIHFEEEYRKEFLGE